MRDRRPSRTTSRSPHPARSAGASRIPGIRLGRHRARNRGRRPVGGEALLPPARRGRAAGGRPPEVADVATGCAPGREDDGAIVHLATPGYHVDPRSDDGALAGKSPAADVVLQLKGLGCLVDTYEQVIAGDARRIACGGQRHEVQVKEPSRESAPPSLLKPVLETDEVQAFERRWASIFATRPLRQGPSVTAVGICVGMSCA